MLSHFPGGHDLKFDTEEDGADLDTVCVVNTIRAQLNPVQPGILRKEMAEDPVLAQVISSTQEGWPNKPLRMFTYQKANAIQPFQRIASSLHVTHRCLPYGFCMVIPRSLPRQILEIVAKDEAVCTNTSY